jgi:glycerophosphoryl diester phosphodiesterase
MQTTRSRDESNGSARQLTFLPEDPFLPSERDDERVAVLGHRGAPAPGRPDNSVAAVTEALLQGADGVEIDVRLTADDTLVCTHDASVRTRTGARRDVTATSSEELDSLATLPELLAAAQYPTGTRVVVEAKPAPDAAVAARTAAVLADVLRTSAGDARITVSSFDADLLRMIREACADLPVRTALLGGTTDSAAAIVGRAHEDRHDEVHLPLAGVRRMPQVVEAAHALGLSVALWTVNRREDLRWVAELGVDAVITDDVLTAWSELDRAATVREMVAA